MHSTLFRAKWNAHKLFFLCCDGHSLQIASVKRVKRFHFCNLQTSHSLAAIQNQCRHIFHMELFRGESREPGLTGARQFSFLKTQMFVLVSVESTFRFFTSSSTSLSFRSRMSAILSHHCLFIPFVKSPNAFTSFSYPICSILSLRSANVSSLIPGTTFLCQSCVLIVPVLEQFPELKYWLCWSLHVCIHGKSDFRL